MTLQSTSKWLCRDHGARQIVDVCWHLMAATPPRTQNALNHVAALLCVLGLALPRVDYAQMTNKTRVGIAMDSEANGRKKTFSAQMERLIDALAGEWSTEIKYEQSEQLPQGGRGRSRDSYRVGPDRSSLVEEYHADGTGGKSWGTGLIWWDQKAQGFRFVWCDSFAIDAGCRVSSDLANWNGDAFITTDVHQVSGEPVFEKEVFSSFSPDSFSQTLYVGHSRDTLKLYMTIKAKRIIQNGMSQSRKR
jgi:hypothetical protein